MQIKQEGLLGDRRLAVGAVAECAPSVRKAAIGSRKFGESLLKMVEYMWKFHLLFVWAN